VVVISVINKVTKRRCFVVGLQPYRGRVFSNSEKPSPPAPLPQGEGSFFSIIKSKIIK
jgi:hypothetical protein